MMRLLSTFSLWAILSFFAYPLQAQLNPGDIMFVGYRFDGVDNVPNCGDGFAFVALVDIPANTTIYFTETEYDGANFVAGEGDLSWTNTEVTAAGTVIRVVTHDSNIAGGPCGPLFTNLGSVQFEGTNDWSFDFSDEEIYAYLGDLRMPTTWLTALLIDSNNGENVIPTALNDLHLDFTSVIEDSDLGIYVGPEDCADRDDCIASILDLDYWVIERDFLADCCDDDGVDYPEDLPDSLYSDCITPVINGVIINACGSNSIQLEVDGMLNGAEEWGWGENYDFDGCESFVLQPGDGSVYVSINPDLDATFFVTAVGGCNTVPICYTFVPSELIDTLIDVTFEAPGPFDSNDGLQPLTSGMPAGGIYTGTGVVDNGDGTFSFDPSLGIGSYTITYVVTSNNGCEVTATDEIIVESGQIGFTACGGALDISDLFGQAQFEPQISTVFDNTGAMSTDDPETGLDCFFDGPSLENTLWFSFVGDGNTYHIRSIECDASNYITSGDTQAVLYSGNCGELMPIACSEDEDYAAVLWNLFIEVITEPGVEYLLMVDGYFGGEGEFCLEITNQDEVIVPTTEVTFQVDASILAENDEVSAEGLFLSGEFNDWANPGEPMTEGSDNIWSVTIQLEAGGYEYKFQNGTDGEEQIETGEDCIIGDSGNRFVEVGTMPMTTDSICFNYCTTCDMVVAVEEITNTNISIFPNPTIGQLFLEGVEAERIDIFNSVGQMVKSQITTAIHQLDQINIAELVAGIYFLRIETKDGVYSARIVKE